MAKKNKISSFIGRFDYLILIYAVMTYFVPQYSIEISFLKFTFGIIFTMYNIIFSIMGILTIAAVIMIYVFTFSDSLDNKLKTFAAPFAEKSTVIKTIINYVKNGALAFFCFELGQKYTATLTIFSIICSTMILVIKDDMTAKAARVALQNMNEETK